jgi:hypothetical protein
MLFSADTNAYNGLSGVISNFIVDIAPFLYILFGIALAFFVIEIIIGIVRKSNDNGNNK